MEEKFTFDATKGEIFAEKQNKKIIFVSHYSENKKIAEAFCNLLKSASSYSR